MKNLLFILSTILLLSFSSCQSILLRLGGFREPQIESKASIFTFLQKLKQDTNDVYVLDTNLLKQLREESFKPGWPKSFRPIQIRVYDKQGKPVMQWASCEGFLKDLKTFDFVPPKNYNGLDTSRSLIRDLSRYSTLEGKPTDIKVPIGIDYYILVYFGKYFPRMSHESFSQVDWYIRKHPELSFKIYKINVDYQEFWGVKCISEMNISLVGSKE